MDVLESVDAYWRAANYLSVGQIYLLDNPLLTEPLRPEHAKPRLLGHWGTTPGLNFIYAHLNRVVVERDVDMIYICGPDRCRPGQRRASACTTSTSPWSPSSWNATPGHPNPASPESRSQWTRAGWSTRRAWNHSSW